ncbi:hypothetical protein C4K35_1887 [Pseudomonas chlororaphis subsp. piscium]|uniref:hypothetical protein n=1 Tax=Pseudomonas chlororaphis TaxID=587753 RepID=UPI000F584322|nr:hypothetical protein [Pseudomonas chlororaphis]AZC49480.1 hypothetical protein C4K35_1887 [Pseudomonas chlororaphis subsp. piscium]
MDTLLERLGAVSCVLFLAFLGQQMYVEDVSYGDLLANFTEEYGIFHKNSFQLCMWGGLSFLMFMGTADKFFHWLRYGPKKKPE